MTTALRSQMYLDTHLSLVLPLVGWKIEIENVYNSSSVVCKFKS
jgi:hypothetical protein